MAMLGLADLSILLIEPSAMQSKLILAHLKEEDITSVDYVTSGKQALESIQKYPPDLVISAMYLPDMTATDLLKSLRESDSYQDINFMLISSETTPSTLEPIRQAGVIAILPKPFDHADLHRALRTTIDYIDPEEMDLENYDVASLNILVVDDSLTARNHIQRVLTSLGIQTVQSANDGAEAAKLLCETDFDLIVTDLNMPEMDGEQLTHFVRNEMGNSYIPILMVTSEHDAARLAHVQQAGVSAIVDKPFEPQSIREILYRVLDD